MRSVLFTLLAAVSAQNEFADWMRFNDKSYKTMYEQKYRSKVFAENLRRIEEHNRQEHSWKMGANKFADMTATEFRAKYITGGYKPRAHKHADSFFQPMSFNLPASVDWSTKGAVTPVKDQGQCGSCWAFSTTGSVEGAYFIKNGTLYSLSEQQLVDCSDAEGNQGCNGGLMDYGFQYIIDNKGITSEKNYPYTATDGTCDSAKEKQDYAQIASFKDVATNSDNALMSVIVQQPVSVAVEADQDSFQLYTGGVMTAACGTALDHGVLAVGYGTSAGLDYYKVKNSWGADWGMNGYILLGRGSQYNGGSGQCGILMDPSYPIV